MLAGERQNRILMIVTQKKCVSVQELMKELNASESTVRRDLSLLDADGQLRKVHGGAEAVDQTYYTKDAEVVVRKTLNREEKEIIAKAAARMIMPGDFIFLDAGTTTEMVIPYITCRDAVFVTNAFSHANQLAMAGLRTYIIEGEIKSTTEAVIGESAVRCLEKYNFTKGFFGTNGISLTQGYTTPEISEAKVKETAWIRCQERFVLADSSKFSVISSVTFAEFSSAVIITNCVEKKEFRTCRNIMEVS